MREDTDLIAMITDVQIGGKKTREDLSSPHNIEITMHPDFQGTIQIKQ